MTYRPKIRNFDGNDITNARQKYEEFTAGDLLYRVAIKMIDLVFMEKINGIKTSDFVVLFIESWNATYFRFKPLKESRSLLKDLPVNINNILEENKSDIYDFRQRTIKSYNHKDFEVVKDLFLKFNEYLGMTGTAKCLHLLAPYFFPLWDANIRSAYKKEYRLKEKDGADLYGHFMRITRDQVINLNINENPLKALDEYNYWQCTYYPNSMKKDLQKCEKNIKLSPNDVVAWSHKAEILQALGQNKKADIALARAKELGYTG